MGQTPEGVHPIRQRYLTQELRMGHPLRQQLKRLKQGIAGNTRAHPLPMTI